MDSDTSRTGDASARRLDGLVLFDGLRHILPWVKVEMTAYLDDRRALSGAIKARTLITGVPDRLFDGSPVCPDTLMGPQIGHEAAFSYLLDAVCREAIRQLCGLACDPSALHGVVPELRAYEWYRPSPGLAARIDRFLRSCDLSPLPIDLAGDIYQKSLSTRERKTFGQYYTPAGIADHLLAQAGYAPGAGISDPDGRILDVATGFGVFLARAARLLIGELRRQGSTNGEMIHALGHNLLGYDVQPFAVIATKLHILATVIEHLALDAEGVREVLTNLRLPGVRVADTVAQPFDTDVAQGPQCPRYVVGNPPYGVCKPGAHLARYGDVVAGRANLYQLFVYFAVRRCAPGGTVALLIPESLRSGRFFRPLRHYLTAHTLLLATTDFHARGSLFPDVQQGVLILAVRKDGRAESSRISHKVGVVQTADEGSLAGAVPFSAPLEHVQMSAPMGYMLFKAGSPDDYALLHKLCHLAASRPLIALGAHTGRFVWNRQRDRLHDAVGTGRLPVIYAPSIRRYGFAFPPGANNTGRRDLLYGEADAALLALSTRGRAILVQRTTSRDQGRRIVATLVDPTFAREHPRYLIENHVNYVDAATCDGAEAPLTYVLGLLNSKLLNFLFAALSGTTHVSAWELGVLPLVHEHTRRDALAALVERRLDASTAQAAPLDQDIDRVVYDIYGLDLAERALIEAFHTYNHSRIGRRIARGS